jgi:glycosyltransferase involved in cell wall biosynthesis
MPVQGRIAVVVTTYNRPDALALVLDGYAAQTDRDFELIVADDGSTEDTRRVVEGFAAGAPFPVRHVWQSDYGFRAAAIRNRAIAATEAAYIIFTDGDCVPATDFAPSSMRARRSIAGPDCNGCRHGSRGASTAWPRSRACRMVRGAAANRPGGKV